MLKVFDNQLSNINLESFVGTGTYILYNHHKEINKLLVIAYLSTQMCNNNSIVRIKIS